MALYVKDFLSPEKTDSQAIADCLEYYIKTPSASVIVFDSKDWYIDNAILIPPDTTIIIDDCMIKQNNEVFDNVFRGNNLIVNPEIRLVLL